MKRNEIKKNGCKSCDKYNPKKYCKDGDFWTASKHAELIKYGLNPDDAVSYFKKNEFVHISKDKEELEALLSANKYNI